MKVVLVFVMAITCVFSFLPIERSFALSEPEIKVKLINYLGNQSSITIKPIGDYSTNDSNLSLTTGDTYVLKQENGRLSVYKNGILLNTYDTFSAYPVLSNSQLLINNRSYLGSFDFTVEKNQYVRPINSVNLEEYLKGVVPIEMYPSWNLEALKTQAVAARTYALSYINRGVIDDTILYQVYGGYIWTPNTTKAVNDTEGQVAEYNGRLIDAVYSASNGGRTESNTNAWGTTQTPYLIVKQDPYDPKTTWGFSFHKTQIDLTSIDLSKPADWWSSTNETDAVISNNIKTWLMSNGYAGKEIKIASIPVFSLHDIGSGGRVSKGDITINFLVKDLTDSNGKLIPQQLTFSNVSAAKIRSIIGNRMMWSYLVSDIHNDTDVVSVNGMGDGHGVGMSQWGAKYMADSGKSYSDILKFYYTGIDIVKVYDSSSQTSGSDGSGAVQTSPAVNPNQTPAVPATNAPTSSNIPGSVAPPAMKTGWEKINGMWYFYNSNGEKAAGWVNDANKWYYLNKNGVMQTGWQLVSGKWYFLTSSGAMATGWLEYHNKWYYLNLSGSMATGWITDKGKRYYLSSSGAMVQNRQLINGKWYLFSSSGYLIH